MESLRADLTTMSEMFEARMNEFQQNLDINPSPLTTTSLAAEFIVFKKFMLFALNALKNQVEFLGREMDRQEMKSRRKTLLFHGISEEKSEDTSARITNLVAESLDLPNFSSASIKSSFRLGRSLGKKPRPLVVKFTDLAVRNKVWFAKAKLKGTGVTQSEFLTKPRHDAFLAARERFGINKCWTRDGCIYVVAPNGTRHRAEYLADLDEIPDGASEEVVKSPAPNIATVKSSEYKGVTIRSKRPVKK